MCYNSYGCSRPRQLLGAFISLHVFSGIKPQRDPYFDDAEAHERLAGIRVQKEQEADDAEEYKFDYEKKSSSTKNLSSNNVDRLINEVEDLLDLGSGKSVA